MPDNSEPLVTLDLRPAADAPPLRTPLYHQIYLVLRQRILDGVLPNGATVPGEFELAQQHNVSRITAKRALDELARDGFVTRGRGKGTRVSYSAPRRRVSAGASGSIEDLLALGRGTEVVLLDFGLVPASDEVAAALNFRRGAMVQRSVRVRRTEDGAFSHLTAYVPADIGDRYDAQALADAPLLVALEKAGVRVAAAEQTIGATLADAETARVLDAPFGSALIKASRTVTDEAGRPVEYLIALYRPDRFQYRMSLSRDTSETAHRWAPTEAGYRLL
ncbi:MAG: GntR family transcriptional regulator [Alphaproteobacteria bacterium]|nr:GntR family transcriptional regulator [Alphaproteobacteria bacterium]